MSVWLTCLRNRPKNIKKRKYTMVDMAEPTLTQEKKGHAVIVSLAAGPTDSETAAVLKVAWKQHCRYSDSIRTPDSISHVQAAIDEDPGMSMRELAREMQPESCMPIPKGKSQAHDEKIIINVTPNVWPPNSQWPWPLRKDDTQNREARELTARARSLFSPLQFPTKVTSLVILVLAEQPLVMELPFVSPASCKRSVIRFLAAKKNSAKDIHTELCQIVTGDETWVHPTGDKGAIQAVEAHFFAESSKV
ncbi:hypothetical protein LAZ67_4000365 [Cordylochernes scorpioides]|uniref:Uncharacterized protein n=1 Tax=Cordylochernes scorpioides TaxID=51811 RepID=A0ABY6KCL8_9ARAC|nr:hypothetical protein LAZ67_4000365 [Cordylochernes scorpioides]